MSILFVASECAPLVKTGGLADVVGALPKALADIGHDVRVLMPAYRGVLDHVSQTQVVGRYADLQGGPARLLGGASEGLNLLLLDAPHLFDRPDGIYLGPDGLDWSDNHLRFGALCRVGADIGVGEIGGWKPDLVHCHDWQAGLTAAYLAFDPAVAPPTIFTIHNIAFQGLFPAMIMGVLGLPPADFMPDGFEYYGQVSFLKAGLIYAERLTTVSPTYARELMTPDFGMGLDGVLRTRANDFCGILNGIDLNAWNPATDPQVVAPYAAEKPKDKALNKRALADAFGIAHDPESPLFCVVSRLTRQKGLDLLLDALPSLLRRGASLVMLGSGDGDLETGFSRAAERIPERIGVRIGYDEPLSHLIQAGADAILIPSRFEPCGLTQLYGLRYGTIPVVARTGGLADTVIDANDAALRAGVATGFQFWPPTADAVADAIERACDAFRDKTLWRKLRRRAMSHPVGWTESALSYSRLYADLGVGPDGH